MHRLIFLLFLCISIPAAALDDSARAEDLATLIRGQELSGFRTANLYSDPDGRIMGAKFVHVSTGAPVFILRIETAPQVFTWVDAPATSNKGLPHSLEHLLAGKGTKGRYFELLKGMRLSQSTAATFRDFNFYGLSSGVGMDGFLEQFHALLDALFAPDFTDDEAEREFYHFAVTTDPTTHAKSLIEAGAVYNEEQSGQGKDIYFYHLNARVLGEQNPFAFDIGGTPDEMRGVTSEEIRRFHAQQYRLGPGTGFIFALNPKEPVAAFLSKISLELQRVAHVSSAQSPAGEVNIPKYPIRSSASKEAIIDPFPGASLTDPGEVRFSWTPVKTESAAELKMLQLFFRALAAGERSLLYKSLIDSKTREMDSGATAVGSEPFLGNSPEFPIWNIGVSGIPGNRVSVEQIDRIKQLILSKIRAISEYPDGSKQLVDFNDLIDSYRRSWRRSQSIWLKSPPGFGTDSEIYWKEHLSVMEMDPAFIRSLSEEPVWQFVDAQLKSGRNVWRDLIQKFHLLDGPYAAGSTPSPQLLEKLERERRERIREKISTLMKQYHANDAQEALSHFEEEELAKTREINKIQTRVLRPRFTTHPPMTPDDEIPYTQFRVTGVPVIASIFDRPPTIDIDLSFDLHEVPRKYYKYIPILPRCFDSMGLRQGDLIVPYSQLSTNVRKYLHAFSIEYEFNAASRRRDLTIRASVTNAAEFQAAIPLIQQIMFAGDLHPANVDRLRDIVTQRISEDDSYTNQSESDWIVNPAYSFREREDALFFALNSRFTWAHWDSRLLWLLHKPVSEDEIEALEEFARSALTAAPEIAREQLALKLENLNPGGLAQELVTYWKKNLPLLPDDRLILELQRLTSEVQDDLRVGPAKTIEDIRELQRIVLNRLALNVDLTLSQSALDAIRPALTGFLKLIPSYPLHQDHRLTQDSGFTPPMMQRLEDRYHLRHKSFPRFMGLINGGSVSANMIAYADFPAYDQLSHSALVRSLASKLFAGNGPQSFHMKAREAGLAYGNALMSNPGIRLQWYYADRSPDIPSLLNLENSTATEASGLHDSLLIDYVLRQSFATPRTMLTPSQRGWSIARDIRDGNTPEKMRRFSEAILKLRQSPNLLSELTRTAYSSICGVLLDNKCIAQQRSDRSLFFFVGPERSLLDIEHRLSMPKLFRIWASDYWSE